MSSVRIRGTLWRSWVRHCTTSRKVAGSITDGFVWIFHSLYLSGRTMAPESTHPLRDISTTGNGDKGGRDLGLTTFPPSCADCHEILDP